MTSLNVPHKFRSTTPPREYDPAHFDRLTRQIEMLFEIINNPGDIRGHALHLTGLQLDSYNLATGDIYYDENGFLKILRAGEAGVQGQSMTASLGTVTVVTT